MLTFTGICKRFHGTAALTDVSFSIEPGSIHALIGENGAGKSTLMKILSGVHTDYEGEIVLDGTPLRFGSPADAQAAGVSIIHQELNLIPELTVAQNIFLGREPTTRFGVIDRRRIERHARELLQRLGLKIAPHRTVHSLRVGEQQLVEIAKALSLDTRILILDEPTSALSDTEIEYLFRVMADLRSHGVTMIYISHKLGEVFRVADTITVLRDGKIVGTVPTAESSESAIIRMMVGRDLSELFPKTSVELGPNALNVRNLTVDASNSAERCSIRDISFDVRKGEIVGLAGLMGSGRTEILEAIYGHQLGAHHSGNIEINGKRATVRSPESAIDHGIALVPEDRKNQSIVHEMSVKHNMTLASLASYASGGVITPRRETAATASMIEALNVKTPGINADIDSLSGGNQQKVVLAKCLLTHPTVLLLDEPTRGIDVNAKSEIYTLMGKIAEGGTGILMASSELPELLAMCDRILVLHEGRIQTELDGPSATEVAIMSAATGNVEAPPPVLQSA